MRLLQRERETLEAYLPGLDAQLAQVPLLELEGAESPGIRLFREANGPALLIPKHYDGLGASPLDALRVTRALGARSPSLMVATTMHQFSVATLVEMDERSEGLEGLFLQAVAQQKLLMSSGFSEGKAGQGILSATMQAERAEKGIIVTGSKRPCSLAHSMDMLTASVAVPRQNGDGTELLVALIPAKSPGIEIRPFWDSPILAGAESDEVVLNGVFVSDRLLFPAGSADALDPVQVAGFLWFELLMGGTYLGVVSALVERVFASKRGSPIEQMALVTEVESAMVALEGIALAMEGRARDEEALARMLFVRYAVQKSIERAGDLAVELIGGISFSTSSEHTYLLAASRGLSLHPPPRTRMAEPLANYIAGGPLVIA